MKTCIVTGSTSGIGRASSIEIAKQGLFENIVIIGRNEKELQHTEELITENNSNISVFPFIYDFGNLNGINSLVDRITLETKTIDVLINAVGYTEPAALMDTTIENIYKTYIVNVFSVLELTKACFNHLKISKGKVLNIASTAGMTPRPGWIAYSSSKASIISISNTLSAELSEYGIKVYCISPGRCATPLRRKLAPNEDFSTIMQPEDVAKMIAYLINSNEYCLDGQNIVIRKQVDN